MATKKETVSGDLPVDEVLMPDGEVEQLDAPVKKTRKKTTK